MSLATLDRLARALDVRFDLLVQWHGGDLARLLNRRHSQLHESVARWFEALPRWTWVPEVSFSVWGERGVIDGLAWHPETRALLVMELKTEIVDVQELVGTLDRKRRLAPGIAEERGWDARSVSSWVIVAESRTNRRRLAAHRSVLRAAFAADGRTMEAWVRNPVSAMSGLSFWPDSRQVSAMHIGRQRRRVRRANLPRFRA